MEFLKELLHIQHKQTLHSISDILNISEFESEELNKRYNKLNYYLVKICNCKIKEQRVQIKDLISKLECDHNPS